MTDRLPDIIIRASSFSTLLDCPERWCAQHPQLGNMRMPSGAPSIMGSGVHAGTAVYDNQRMIRVPPSVEQAIQVATDFVRNPEEDVIWDDFRQNEAIDIVARLTQNYCINFASRWHFDAVELPMDHWDVVAANGLVIRFTGHIDRRRVEWDEVPGNDGKLFRRERKGICDLKTGKRVMRADGTVNTQVSGAQMAQYELLELLSTKTLGKEEMLPAMIFAFPTSGKLKPAAATIDRPHRLFIGDAHNKGAIDIAADIIKSGNYWGNARSILCSPKYCPKHGKCRWQMTGETVYDD